MTRLRMLPALALTLAAGLALSACSSDDAADSGASGGATAASAPVVIATTNFTETKILAHMYAQVLENAGQPAQVKELTTREVIAPALEKGEVQATTEYLGTLTDQDKAREAAKAYIDQGYDVVCASANSAQLGCLWAAEDAGVYAIGFNSDQYNIAPNAVVLSVMRNYTMIYKDVFDKLVAGTWTPGKVAYELNQGGTLVSDWHGWDAKLPKEKVDAINEFITKLFNGDYEGQY